MNREKFTIKNNSLEIGGVECSELASKFGTPIYVYDQNKIEKMIQTYKKAIQENYGFGDIFYASKAFSCKEMYRLAKQNEIGIDVVSGGELYTAKSVDFPSNKIIFHGNNKSLSEIIDAVSADVEYLVIDSFSEALKINKVCADLHKKQNVLIRVNPGIEAHTHKYIQTSKIDSKFGFSIDSGEAFEVIKQVLELENINLKGLHCHIGSQIFERESFLQTADKMISFYSFIKKNLGFEFDVLDLGGGIGIWYNEDDNDLSYDDYYDFIKGVIDRVKMNVERFSIKKPFLMLEPGRSIVGEAGITLYTVGSIKEIKDLKTYLAIDGGMFENPRFALYQAKYTVVAPTKINESCKFKYSIAGKCCESGDKIREDCFLPKIEEGDILAVLSTGAYNYSMASNYNRNCVPAVIFVKDGNPKLVVKAQSYQDLIKNDI